MSRLLLVFNLFLAFIWGYRSVITAATKSLIHLALDEDIGYGDCTTEFLIDRELTAEALVLVKQPSRIVGLSLIEAVFATLDPSVTVTRLVTEGADISAATAVCKLSGSARSILTGERIALNFLGRLSGIATLTRDAVAQLAGTNAKLLDTRKTTPGWRTLEKYAVRMGGGFNHRFGLFDMVLIKDNHIALSDGIAAAVRKTQTLAGPARKIEVEVETLEQLREAAAAQVDMILLDNMDISTMRQAVLIINGQIPLEASGNMTLERLPEVANTGVDFISMGALTHSAVSRDVGLDISFTN